MPRHMTTYNRQKQQEESRKKKGEKQPTIQACNTGKKPKGKYRYCKQNRENAEQRQRGRQETQKELLKTTQGRWPGTPNKKHTAESQTSYQHKSKLFPRKFLLQTSVSHKSTDNFDVPWIYQSQTCPKSIKINIVQFFYDNEEQSNFATNK